MPAAAQRSAQLRIEQIVLPLGQQVAAEPQSSRHRVAADGTADVEDRRPRHAEVGEEQCAALPAKTRGGRVVVVRIDHLHHGVRDCDSLHRPHPAGLRGDRHQRGPRPLDGVSQLGRPAIAVASGAGGRVRHAAGREDYVAAGQRSPRRDQVKKALAAAEFLERFVGGDLAAGPRESGHERREHVGRPIGTREDLAVGLGLRGHAFGLEQVDDGVGRERRQGRSQERPLRAECLGNVAGPGGVGQIAAVAAGEKNLAARLGLLFQQECLSLPLGRAERRHQPGRSPAHHDNVITKHGRVFAGRSGQT